LVRRGRVDGPVSTIAGGGNSYSDGVQSVKSTFSALISVWGDSASSLYVTDAENAVIRMINLNSMTIFTVAGSFGLTGFSGESLPANQSMLFNPRSVWGNTNGVLYFLENCEHYLILNGVYTPASRIMQVSNGVISTAAGNCSENDNNYYIQLVGDNFGNLFVMDGRDQTIKMINTSSDDTVTIVGGGTSGLSGVQPAVEVFIDSSTLWIDSQGSLYFDNTLHHTNSTYGTSLYKVSSNLSNLLTVVPNPTASSSPQPTLLPSSVTTMVPTASPFSETNSHSSSLLLIEELVPVGIFVLFGLCIFVWIQKRRSNSSKVYAANDLIGHDNCGLPFLSWNQIDVHPSFCGPYAILGQGSFGTVVRAKMKASNQSVAIKVVTKSRTFHLNRSYEVILVFIFFSLII
jgi:hypothetical protein